MIRRGLFALALAAAALAPMTACTPPVRSAGTPAAEAATVDAIAAGYQQTRSFALMLLPYLSPAREAKARIGIAVADVTIAALRSPGDAGAIGRLVAAYREARDQVIELLLPRLSAADAVKLRLAITAADAAIANLQARSPTAAQAAAFVDDLDQVVSTPD